MKSIFLFKKGFENSIVLYVLLFLACLNFLGRGPVIFLAFCIWGYIRTYGTKINWNVSSICYLAMSFFASIASFLFFDEKEVLKSLVYFLAFGVGYKGYVASVDKIAYIRRIIFCAFAGYVLNLGITYYVNFVVIGHIAGKRELYSFWTNDLISVTLAGLMSSVPIAYSCYCIFCRQSFLYKILAIACIALIVLVNMGTATRTPFILMGIVFCYIICELFFSKDFRNKKLLIILFILTVLALFYKVLPQMEGSALAERFTEEGMNTSRIDITITYINNMFDCPFGGSEIYANTKLLAHNFIFEAYDMYGFIFFIFMIILFVQMIRRVYFLHKIPLKSDVSYLLLLVYIAVGIQVMLEPVIGGYPQLIWTLFLVDGMTVPYLRETYKTRMNS